MKQIFILVTVLLTAVACQDFNNDKLPTNGVVHFNKQNVWITRGTPTTDANHDEFYVFAHKFPNGTSTAFTANYMDNVKVEKDGNGNWDYSPKCFWPASTEEVEFMAYSPLPTAENGLSNLEITNGEFSVTYTVPTDITHQPDLMLAKTDPLSNELVNLPFKHLLAQVSFSVKGDPNMRIKSVVLDNIVKSGTYKSREDEWTYSTGVGNKTCFGITILDNDLEDVAPSGSSQNITADDAYLFMIPQTVATGNRVIIIMKDVTKPSALDVKDTLTFAADQTWIAGKKYNYCIDIPQGEILDLEDIGDYNGTYPPGDTWVFVDTIPGNANWNDLRQMVWRANDAGVDVKLIFPNLTTLGNGYFDGSNITSFIAPNLVDMPNNFLFNCPKLEHVELPRLKEIHSTTFQSCTSLETLILDSVEIIGSTAFQNCTTLTVVELPLAKTIENSAFYGCNSLDTLILSSVETIGGTAFQGCQSLTTVRLPRVKNIENNAFYGCTSLETMELATDPGVELQSVAAMYQDGSVTPDLTIGSANAGFITTNNSNPALRVGDGAINMFKTITTVNTNGQVVDVYTVSN